MISSPSESIKLTDDQTKQLEAFKAGLEVLQNEFALASKRLIETRRETNTVIKEKDYQQSLLNELVDKSVVAQKSLDVCLGTLHESERKLKENTDRANVVGQENDKKAKELEVREKEVERLEKEYRDRILDVNERAGVLTKELSTVQKAKDEFLKAIESVTWK